ncbi:MAG: hypothetical protein U0441_33080 [Polyangiaceae bacterium]
MLSRIRGFLFGSVWGPVAALVLLAVVFVARSAFSVRGEAYFPLADDAMVSMRYAKNLVDGHGLVWNVRQTEGPVEGYSNFAWTLWMAVLHLFRLPDSKVGLLVMASGVGLLAANVGVARALAREIAPENRTAAALAGWLIALDHSLIAWTLRGFEVALCAFTVTLGALFALRSARAEKGSMRTGVLLCAVAALSVLTRDDMLPLWGWIATSLILTGKRRCRIVAATLLGTVAVVIGAHVLYRMRVYGAPLPNTAALKLGGTSVVERWPHGARTLGQALLLGVPVGLAALVSAGRSGAVEGDRSESANRSGGVEADRGESANRSGAVERGAGAFANRGQLLLAGLFVMACVYSIHVGGDSLEHEAMVNRFVSVTLPVLWVLVAFAMERLARGGGHRDWDVAAGVTLLVALLWSAREPVRFEGAELLRNARIAGIVGAYAVLYFTSRGATSRTASAPLRTPRSEVQRSLRGSASVLPVEPGGTGHVLLPLIALVVGCQLPVWSWSFVERPIWADEDETVVRYGLALGEATSPEARIGVTWAGAIPYFAHRDAVDFFGKCDARIANGPVHRGRLFAPGHNKWDLDHSVGGLRPDVIAQLPADEADVPDKLATWGYDRVGPEVFVLRRANGVDRTALLRAACTIPWSRDDVWMYLGDDPAAWRARMEAECPR